MDVTPFLRIPLTDFTSSLMNMQMYERCGNFEMNYIDCLEAYGGERGKTKCKDLLEDLRECCTREKQFLRIKVIPSNIRIINRFSLLMLIFQAMRDERKRQYEAGERKKEELYAESPKHDAY